MSYLGPNRFTFSGTFQAAISTINNSVANYGKKSTSETDQSWNPEGGGFWRIQDCTVKSAVVTDCPGVDDPVIGSPFVSIPDPVPGKLVDLDPDQQGASQIWGMKLALGNEGSPNSFAGNFKVIGFKDLWTRRENPEGVSRLGSPGLSASYQSVLENIEWADELTSPLLHALRADSPGKLSIKFNVDLYDWYDGTVNQRPAGLPELHPFTFGRVVGAIGPYLDGEPEHFVSGRLLRNVFKNRPTTGNPLYFAPCLVENSKIYLDLGNSMRTKVDGSIDPDQGTLRLAILDRDTPGDFSGLRDSLDEKGAPVRLDSSPVKHIFDQALDYTNYLDDAGIVMVAFGSDLDPEVTSAPLGLVSVDCSGNLETVLLRENSAGWFVRADSFVARLNPGESSSIRLRVTRFGHAAPDGTRISLAKSSMGSGDPSLGALGIPKEIATVSDGWADFEIEAGDPGYPRQFSSGIPLNLDGQVYRIDYSLPDHQTDPSLEDRWNFVSALVSTDWKKVAQDFDRPTWNGDVEQVLNQYGVLYPVMREKIGISLGDFTSVKENIVQILKYMEFPRTDPRHMPVTRDLSASKLQLIKNWQANGCPE